LKITSKIKVVELKERKNHERKKQGQKENK
jgi:hypothetical protein